MTDTNPESERDRDPEQDPDSPPQLPEIEATGDGSHTLYSSRFNQHYHNPNGAVGESLHVFFQKNGLLDRLTREDSTEPLSILEVGFGSGLNLLLLLDEYLKCGAAVPVTYCSIEAYPIDRQMAGALNYGNYLVNRDLADRLVEIFREARPGMNRFEPLPGVELLLFVGMFDAFEPGKFRADFIFHDPFSPEANPDLWTGEVFRKLAGWSKPGAVLSTYCAASEARGAMCWAGWHVAREQGALGKREMTVASLDPDKLAGLDRVNEERLARRYEEGDF